MLEKKASQIIPNLASAGILGLAEKLQVMMLCPCVFQAELADLQGDDAPAPAPAPSLSPAKASPAQSPSMLAPTTSRGLSPQASSGAMSSRSDSSAGGDMVAVVQDRINNYQQAFDNARSMGDASKQRRLDRGLKVSIVCWVSSLELLFHMG